MKPELRANAGIYTLTWPDQQLRVRIDRIREDSRYQVTGEVLVQSLIPDTPAHLHQARLNLTSTNARRTLARHLEEVSKAAETDWGAIVEQACVLTLDAYREGEPLTEINEVLPRQAPRHRLAPFLVEGHPNMVFGSGGAGKSLWAALTAILISSGSQHLHMEPLPGRVLYLDYEMSAEELRERVTLIENGLNEPRCSDILYRFCHLPLPAEVDDIQRLVSDNKVEFLIVDSMGMACGGDPNKPEFAIDYFRALRSLRVTSLTVHHISKGAADSSNPTPYGSVYIPNSVRSVWHLRSAQEPGENVMQMGMFHHKTNFGPLLKPIGFSATFGDAQITFSPSEVKDTPMLAQLMRLGDRIAHLLMTGAEPMTVADISDTLATKADQIRARLNEGRGKRFVVVEEGKEPKWGAYFPEG